ncbi:hypothetical protein EZ313_21995 [Ramlibacter henchirensis]|uniref:Uncharacterized protein n=1 Tax=Ramlibacter henchirensis TaxID=204072 RepID=A0A4Z0BKE3_9BURK|nr:hypothetical protein EZ313_21995 [Ramlibacter henchirensis]
MLEATLVPFEHVHPEYLRATQVEGGVDELAHEGDRLELVVGLPYGRPLLDLINAFRAEYIRLVIGRTVAHLAHRN